MPDIVLATLNAKYAHASFGLRYLLANLGPLRSRAAIAEFEIKQTPLEIAESLLALSPRILGLGVYIWNARPTLDLVALLKRLHPRLRIVLGGPEVSHEWEDQEIVRLADHTLTGEADLAFRELCLQLLSEPSEHAAEPGATSAPPRILHAPLPALDQVQLPYDEYTDADLAHRVIYVEASRGCPFTCEFCLSSLDLPVRAFPLEPFLAALDRLLQRGARQFKFVDRTFNLNLPTGQAILQFFLDRWRDGLFLHFEMIPDRLPDGLRDLIRRFPAGALQFEIGIQSFNPDVCTRIRRRQDVPRTEANLRFLAQETGVHVHADLIAGLPGETLSSFGEGFDRLLRAGPQEIQVGILKRLRGTPITRHDDEWSMRYSPVPPYDILEHRELPFAEVQRLRRFARYWDLVANSGRFKATLPLVWTHRASPFQSFLEFSDWLFMTTHQTHAIALDRLAQLLFRWLTEARSLSPSAVAEALAADSRSQGVRDLPPWLAPHAPPGTGAPRKSAVSSHARRQARHLAAPSPPSSGPTPER
ncbi:MAG: B12-binding domain-containing radical SAM protein [Verrucomicrobiales bacterium]|nr:B12-binding domain-containing radical SAM protein [Verrucomicrobiales bacterium]